MMRFTYWFWILLLLFHTACNGCRKYEIAHEADQWGAAVAIDSVNSPGSINGYPVLELCGTISKNVPGVDTPFLCALMVPAGETPDAGAIAIQGHKVAKSAQDASSNALSMGKLHPLSGGSFVQYDTRALNPDETGAVGFSIASWDSDNSLALDTKYDIYLGIKVGPHFFYDANAHADYTLPDATSLTQIKMNSAQCDPDRDNNGQVLPKLSARATVANFSNLGNAGFLFLKRGANLTPVGVLAKQLEAGSVPLPTTHDTLTARPDSGVVICPTAINANFEITDVEDTAGILEKGATYDVYGYVANGNQYFVSQDSCAITLPMIEIEVAMNRVENLGLIATKRQPSDTAEYDVSEFKLAVSGRIKKIDNAKDPIAGFVFVKEDQAQDKTTICPAITGAISNAGVSGEVIDVNNNKTHVVCIAKTTGVDTAQTITHVCDLKGANGSRLDLTSDYRVYFWVKDAKGDGEMFLSDSGQALRMFYVEGAGITNVTSSHTGNQLTIRPEIDISSLRNANDARMEVVLFAPSTNREVRFPIDEGCTGGVKEIGGVNGHDLQEETEYQLYLVVWRGGVRYPILSTTIYRTPALVGRSSPNPIVILDGEKKIELNIDCGQAYHIHDNGKRLITFRRAKNVGIIKAALDQYYSKGDERDEAYRKFGVAEN